MTARTRTAGERSARQEVVAEIRTFVHGPATHPAMVITGPPGIGKSMLLRDVLSDLPPELTLRARGRIPESDVPFAMLSELLAGRSEVIAGLPIPQRRALQAALAITDGPPPEPLPLGLAVAATVDELAADGRVVVTVDDVHIADRSSCRALSFACSRLAGEDVSVLLASRPQIPPAIATLPTVELPPMAEAEVAALVRAHGRAATPGLVAQLLHRTGGNPLALTEVLRRGDDPTHTAWPSGPLDVGETLRAAYRDRIAALPPQTRQALLLLATDDGTSPVAVMTALTAAGLDDELSAAVDAGLVSIGGGAPTIVHPLMRSAVWHEADPVAQAWALRTLAAHEPDLHRRSWYLGAAASQPDETAAAAIEHAGLVAMRRGAMAEAGAALTRAAELSPDPTDRSRRHLTAGSALWAAGDLSLAADALQSAITTSDEPATRGRAQQLLARLWIFTGALADAEAALRSQAQVLRDTAPRVAARLLAEAVWPCVIDNRWGEGLALAEDAVTLLDDPTSDLFVHATHLANRAGLGLPVAPDTLSALATTFQRMPPDDLDWLPVGYLILNTAMLHEEHRIAHEVVGQMLHRGRVDGAVGTLPLTLSCASDLDWWAGDWLSATARAEEAMALGHELGDTVDLARAHVTLARIHLTTTERWAEGLAVVDEELRSPVRWGRSATLAARGLGHLGRGEVDRAVADLQQAAELDRDRRHGLHHPRISAAGADLCTALVAAGRTQEASRWLQEWRSSGGADGEWAQGAALRCQALLTDDLHAAAALTEEALVLLARFPFERGRLLLEHGRRQRRGGVDPRTALRQAMAIFTDLGASLWTEQARAELRAAGDRVAARRGSPIRALSGQELRVALKVAEGMTNREVAAALFLSPKTVEAHLTRIYARLGIRSRVDLTRLVSAAERPPGH